MIIPGFYFFGKLISLLMDQQSSFKHCSRGAGLMLLKHAEPEFFSPELE
jgi:hypothetical protein